MRVKTHGVGRVISEETMADRSDHYAEKPSLGDWLIAILIGVLALTAVALTVGGLVALTEAPMSERKGVLLSSDLHWVTQETLDRIQSGIPDNPPDPQNPSDSDNDRARRIKGAICRPSGPDAEDEARQHLAEHGGGWYVGVKHGRRSSVP